MSSKWKMKEAQWLGGQIEIIYEDFKYQTKVNEWSFLVDFFQMLESLFISTWFVNTGNSFT